MISLLVSVSLLGLLTAMFMAPLETLGWWAGWYGDEGETRPEPEGPAPYRNFGDVPADSNRHFVVFLDGIAKVGDINYDEVQVLLDDLAARVPGAVVLGDVMPYSVLSQGLLQGRPLAGFWRLAFRLKQEGRAPLVNFMINIRNLFQVLVAADARYGPLFGQGEAAAILNSLGRHGYEVGEDTPVTLIGYSGGSQMALTAAPYLRTAVKGQLNLISLGGVMADEPGFMALDRVWQLQGSRDRLPDIIGVFFPGRWPLFRSSYWNRLKSEGRYERRLLPPIRHSGRGSYLDNDVTVWGKTPREHTVQALAEVLQDIERHNPASGGNG